LLFSFLCAFALPVSAHAPARGATPAANAGLGFFAFRMNNRAIGSDLIPEDVEKFE
jgi:hypothetical protein